MKKILQNAKEASIDISLTSNIQRNEVLLTIAKLLELEKVSIIASNLLDLEKLDDTNPKKDRLLLNEDRIQQIAESIKQVTELPNPSGTILVEKTLPNGLQLQKISVPFGVVGAIYESRPNVTVDVSVLNIKSGNATILRGSSEAENTNKILLELIQKALKNNNLNPNIVQLMSTEREDVTLLLHAEKEVDLIIPRGSKSLIDFVRKESKVPVIETGAGVCHTFIEKSANLTMASEIIANTKIQRPSVCNSLDTIIADIEILEALIPKLIEKFSPFEVKIFADDQAFEILNKNNYPFIEKANEENFGMEYLSLQCSLKTVKSYTDAIKHIQKYSSKHSECIVTENKDLAENFLQIIDAASVYHNASTRFTDGDVFGLGAEIGISTQKLHARGPFALEKLVTEKWIVRGTGQIR